MELKYHEIALNMKRKNFKNMDHPSIYESLLNVSVAYSHLKDEVNQMKYQNEAWEMRNRLFAIKEVFQCYSFKIIQLNIYINLDFNFKS
jgi:hypothetical protein